jgi:hypothetical protein
MYNNSFNILQKHRHIYIIQGGQKISGSYNFSEYCFSFELAFQYDSIGENIAKRKSFQSTIVLYYLPASEDIC